MLGKVIIMLVGLSVAHTSDLTTTDTQDTTEEIVIESEGTDELSTQSLEGEVVEVIALKVLSKIIDSNVLTDLIDDFGREYTDTEVSELAIDLALDIADGYLSDFGNFDIADEEVLQRDAYKKFSAYIGFSLFYMSVKMCNIIFGFFTKKRKGEE